MFFHLVRMRFFIEKCVFEKLAWGVLGAYGVWRRKNERCSPLVILLMDLFLSILAQDWFILNLAFVFHCRVFH